MTLFLTACVTAAETGVGLGEVEVHVDAEIATVLHVSWRTNTPTTGTVRFGDEGLTRTVDDATPSTTHSVSLLGLPPDHEIQLQVSAIDADGHEGVSDTITAATDAWPPEVPRLTLTGEVTSWVGGFLALSTVTSHMALVLDSDGRVVWAKSIAVEDDETLMRVRLTADGSALLALVSGHTADAYAGSHLVNIQLDGSAEETLMWPFLDHDVVELPDGSLAGIVKELRDGYAGDTIVERSGDGTFRTVYSTWDDPVVPQDPDGQLDGELTHANALDYDDATDAYYVNLYLPKMFVRVDRDSGVAAWHLYGPGSEFTAKETDPLQNSHQFQVLGADRFLHFENGGGEALTSGVREFELDESSQTYQEVWRYEPDPAMLIYVKGDVERYADGGTGVLWATAGRVEDLDQTGTSVWHADLDLGDAFTYFQHVARLGP